LGSGLSLSCEGLSAHGLHCLVTFLCHLRSVEHHQQLLDLGSHAGVEVGFAALEVILEIITEGGQHGHDLLLSIVGQMTLQDSKADITKITLIL